MMSEISFRVRCTSCLLLYRTIGQRCLLLRAPNYRCVVFNYYREEEYRLSTNVVFSISQKSIFQCEDSFSIERQESTVARLAQIALLMLQKHQLIVILFIIFISVPIAPKVFQNRSNSNYPNKTNKS